MIYATFIQIEFGSRKKEGLTVKGLKCREERSVKINFFLFDSVKIFFSVVYTPQIKAIKYSFRYSDVPFLSATLEYVSIQ